MSTAYASLTRIVVVGLIAVGLYHMGKSRGRDDTVKELVSKQFAHLKTLHEELKRSTHSLPAKRFRMKNEIGCVRKNIVELVPPDVLERCAFNDTCKAWEKAFAL